MANQLDLGLRAFDANGYISAGAKALIYLTGTSTLIDVWTDADGSIAAANPIIADGNGYWPQRFVSQTAKVVITDADDVTLQTLDPAPTSIGTGSAASEISFAPTVEVPFTNVQDAVQGTALSVLAGVTAYGIGITGNAPLLANIDATNTASGVYRWDGASTGTFPTGITAATTGLIDFDRQTAAEGMQTLRALGQTRVYQRFLASTAWGAWREAPSMTDPGANSSLGWDDTANAFAWGNPVGPQLRTSVAAASQTSIDFTGVPSWVNRVTVLFSTLSTNGTSGVLIQLGDSGGFETTSYVGSNQLFTSTATATDASVTTGFLLTVDTAAGAIRGTVTLSRHSGNLWIADGMFRRSSSSFGILAGEKTLSATLTQIRITNVNGTDTFDGGAVNISWE